MSRLMTKQFYSYLVDALSLVLEVGRIGDTDWCRTHVVMPCRLKVFSQESLSSPDASLALQQAFKTW